MNFHELPSDLLVHTLAFVDVRDRLEMRAVSRVLCGVIDDPAHDRALFQSCTGMRKSQLVNGRWRDTVRAQQEWSYKRVRIIPVKHALSSKWKMAGIAMAHQGQRDYVFVASEIVPRCYVGNQRTWPDWVYTTQEYSASRHPATIRLAALSDVSMRSSLSTDTSTLHPACLRPVQCLRIDIYDRDDGGVFRRKVTAAAAAAAADDDDEGVDSAGEMFILASGSPFGDGLIKLITLDNGMRLVTLIDEHIVEIRDICVHADGALIDTAFSIRLPAGWCAAPIYDPVASVFDGDMLLVELQSEKADDEQADVLIDCVRGRVSIALRLENRWGAPILDSHSTSRTIAAGDSNFEAFDILCVDNDMHAVVHEVQLNEQPLNLSVFGNGNVLVRDFSGRLAIFSRDGACIARPCIEQWPGMAAWPTNEDGWERLLPDFPDAQYIPRVSAHVLPNGESALVCPKAEATGGLHEDLPNPFYGQNTFVMSSTGDLMPQPRADPQPYSGFRSTFSPDSRFFVQFVTSVVGCPNEHRILCTDMRSGERTHSIPVRIKQKRGRHGIPNRGLCLVTAKGILVETHSDGLQVCLFDRTGHVDTSNFSWLSDDDDSDDDDGVDVLWLPS